MKRADRKTGAVLRGSIFGTLTFALVAASLGTSASAADAYWRHRHRADQPPTISGSPPTSDKAGTAYIFKPTAADADGNALKFAIRNQPGWSMFNSSTGQLSGTPTTAQVGNYSNIVISVSDGKMSAALPAFAIAVTAPAAAASPPTISGSPATSDKVGTAYSFTPKTTDPSGGALTFSVANKPSWLALNATTGQLTGTPVASNTGTYANILISVSDGKSKASLPAFTLTVAAATGSTPTTNGSATVKWTAPTKNTDGSALTNLAGYYVTYGTSAGNLTKSAQVASVATTSYTVTNLTSGTWYFAVKSYTTAGVQSGLSQVGSKSIQ